MELGLFSLAMCFGLLTARAADIAYKSDNDDIKPQNSFVKVVNFGSMISTFSMIAWGFINLNWWEPIYIFALFYLAASLLINQNRVRLFLSILPITSVITIVSTLYLWSLSLFLPVA